MQFKCPPYLENKDMMNPEKLLEVLPAHPQDAVWLHGLLIHASFGKAMHDQCIKSADYLLEHTTDKDVLFWAYYLKGCSLEKTDKDAAIELMKKAIELDPEAETTLGVLAGLYMDKKKYDEALDCYFKLEALLVKKAEEDEEPFNDYTLYSEIAEAYFLKRDYEKAGSYFQKALDIKKDSTTALCGLGRVTASAGNNDKALEYFAQALELDKTDAFIYYYHGHAWQNKHDVYRAMHYYTEALKLRADFPHVFNNIAALCMNEDGDVKGAIDNMMKALEQTKKDDQFLIILYMNLSRLYNTIADYDKEAYYKVKLLQAMGFPAELEEGDDDGMEETE